MFYDARNKEIRVWGWDEYGNRNEHKEPYSPYLYVETNSEKYDATSIFGSKLRRVEFTRSGDRRKFVDRHPTGRVFHNLQPEQQYAVDNFRHYSTEQLTKNPFRIAFIDIEVHSPDEFPTATEARHPINVMTVYDTLTGMFMTWGTKPFNEQRLNEVMKEQGIDEIDLSKLEYVYCKSEFDLLDNFLEWWINNFPDIVTGWNSDPFDIPYIINRVTRIFDERAAKLLSPVHQLYGKEDAVNLFSQTYTKWSIRGIHVLDYMQLYRTFSRGDSESYKLGDVGAKELGIGKIAHDAGDLVTLADTDWDLFVAYNIQDVNLLVEMEKKLQFLSLARFVTTKGFAKAESALGKISIVSGAISAQAMKQGKVLSTFRSNDLTRDEYDGGFVREPVAGLHTDVVSYDANSLYPNVMITLNISPETKVGKIASKPTEHNENYIIVGADGTRRELTPEKFEDVMVRGECTISAFDVIYTQKVRGVVPSFIDGLYTERVDAKDKMYKISRALESDPTNAELQTQLAQLDIIQYTIKILLNSIYGNFANVVSPLFDIDGAGSITLSGQATIKQAGVIANEWAKDTFGQDLDIVVYGDTDSVYLSLEDIDNLQLLDDDRILTAQGRNTIEALDDRMNVEIDNWSKQNFRSTDSRLVFKREVIADTGIFLRNKRYVLRVAYDEETAMDKIKYTGVEVARSSHSEPVKSLIKEVVETLFKTRDMAKTISAYESAYEKFAKLPIDDIAKRQSLNKLDEYAPLVKGLAKPQGVRIHFSVMGAIIHNELCSMFDVSLKYPPLRQGEKIKIVNVHPNDYGFTSMAFGSKFPDETGITVDVDTQFNKQVRPVLLNLFNAIEWELPKNVRPGYSSLMDMFG